MRAASKSKSKLSELETGSSREADRGSPVRTPPECLTDLLEEPQTPSRRKTGSLRTQPTPPLCAQLGCL